MTKTIALSNSERYVLFVTFRVNSSDYSSEVYYICNSSLTLVSTKTTVTRQSSGHITSGIPDGTVVASGNNIILKGIYSDGLTTEFIILKID